MQHVAAALDWLERLPLAVAIARSNWVFPAIETIHVIALTLTIGTVLIVDLRLLSLPRGSNPTPPCGATCCRGPGPPLARRW